jgi:hypothetical protein
MNCFEDHGLPLVQLKEQRREFGPIGLKSRCALVRMPPVISFGSSLLALPPYDCREMPSGKALSGHAFGASGEQHVCDMLPAHAARLGSVEPREVSSDDKVQRGLTSRDR